MQDGQRSQAAMHEEINDPSADNVRLESPPRDHAGSWSAGPHPRRVDARGEQVLPVGACTQLLAGLWEVQILPRRTHKAQDRPRQLAPAASYEAGSILT